MPLELAIDDIALGAAPKSEDECAFECHTQGLCQAHKEGKNGGSLGLKGFAMAAFWL